LLIGFLKGNSSLDYEKFKYLMIDYFTIYINKLNEKYACQFMISNSITFTGICYGVEKIIINEREVRKIYNGNISSLLTIFHEISHLQQNIQIEEGIVSKNIINYIKDNLLRYYQDEQNKKFGISKNSSYYILNYKYESSEIDANLNSILLFLRFCSKNEIELPKQIEKILETEFSKLEVKKNFKRYVGENIIFNSYYLSLDESFDLAINDHPEWLEFFPQLNTEYFIVDDKICKKDNINYEECDNDESLYSYYLKKVK